MASHTPPPGTDPPEYMNYFLTAVNVTGVAEHCYDLVGEQIKRSQYIFHRGAFYRAVASVIRYLIDVEFYPFMGSAYNWLWWADECEKHANSLGMDAQFAMRLPAPLAGVPTDYGYVTNQLDELVTKTMAYYAEEEGDEDRTELGQITPAECVKLTHRFAAFVLEPYCYSIEKPTPEHPGVRVTWPWLAAVTEELKAVFIEMGEVSRAGDAGEPGGPIPPISWPGES